MLMDYRTLVPGLFLSTAAVAGTVHFETDTAATVTHGGVTIARATGPGMLTLGDFPAGATHLEVQPENRSAIRVSLTLPEQEEVRVKLSKNRVSSSTGNARAHELPAPTLGFRTEPGESFTVVIDGTQSHTLTDQLLLDSLRPGRHTVEIRSPDRLIVWVRGTVDLMAGDAIVLGIAEGRMAVADGLHTAWTPSPGDTR